MKLDATLSDILKYDLEVGAVPAMMGEPGIGKSSFVDTLAMSMGTKAFTLACNQLADKADLTGGRLVPTADGKSYRQVFYPHEVIQEAIQYAEANPREWPILFLDEINRSTSDVTSAALSLPTMRKIGSSPLPKNLRIVVAGNDKGNVTTLDEASLSRFAVYRVEPDAQTLIGILGSEINEWVKAVLIKFPNLVFAKGLPTTVLVDGTDPDDDSAATYSDLLDAGEEMLQLTTPRTIHGISRWLNVVPRDKLLEYLQTTVINDGTESTLLSDIIVAHIGNTDFAAHLLSEVASGITSGNTGQNQSLTAPKPNCYADLKAASTVTDLEALILSLTDNERSGSLVYALFERANNKVLIEQLAQHTDALQGDHNRTLVQLAAQSMLDEDNVSVLFGTTTDVGKSTQMMISAFMS
ncbi:AAA domain (dynein-related subfamily) [Plantibacter flavus]|uniref:Dynein-related subfamily AAA family protein n=1 Tax=Plantibacter flavus TaxID=150123 RepID=A0A3N2BLF8_9MICO|nr:AAA family ATPase [Plantibacter flavus]ROR76012.1 dynein-related subfamily AAA family protein [Plantibacter flavus]SMG49299.1 AAA domain (dynein-related subfamily) [Plantibacter flavus]